MLFFCLFLEIQDDDNSLAVLYQTISELPEPNRDTLACLMIHLQKSVILGVLIVTMLLLSYMD